MKPERAVQSWRRWGLGRRLGMGLGLGLTVLALAVAAVFVWQGRARPKTPAVITEAAKVEDLEDAVLATGTLHAIKQVNVGSQASGQVKHLYVQLGDKVHHGQLIAEIDPSTQIDALRNAQAQVALLRSQLRAKQVVLEEAKLSLQRQQTLLAKDATARASYDDALTAQANAQSDVDVTQDQIEQAVIAVDAAKVALDYTRITAPMDGVVIGVVTQEGQTVNAVQTAPTIIKLAQLDRMRIQAQISEADVVRVHPGLPVYFTILGEPDQRISATLQSIEPAPTTEQSDSSTGSATSTTTSSSSSSSTAVYYNGLFDVPNPQGRLRVDMTAQVNIVLANARGVLTIASAALGAWNAKTHTYEVKVLVHDGAQTHLASRQVRIGLNNHVRAQVLAGLQAGDEVVLGQANADDDSRRGPRMF